MELMYIIYLIEVVTNIKMWNLTVGIGIFVCASVTYLLISAIQADTTRDVYFKDRLEVYFKTIKKYSYCQTYLRRFPVNHLFFIQPFILHSRNIISKKSKW